MDVLHTPAGDVLLKRSDGTRIPFTVQPNAYRPACGVLLPEETLLLTAEAECFEPGHTYSIVLSTGELYFCGADENRQALCALHNGCAIGLGACDPNDGVLLHCDWTLRQYMLRTAQNGCGFDLQILEKLSKPIVFYAAWLRSDGIPARDCEQALALWLT